MLLTGELAGFQFDHANVIDFWLVRFTTIEIEKTMAENMISYLKNDNDNGWYNSLQTAALILNLKFTILSISMLENNVYNLTIVAMIYLVLMFDLQKMESTAKKYKLIYCPILCMRPRRPFCCLLAPAGAKVI